VLVVGTCSAQRSTRVLLVVLLFRQLVEEATPGGAQRFGRGRQQTAHVPVNLSRLSQSPTGVTRRFDSSLNSRKDHKTNKKRESIEMVRKKKNNGRVIDPVRTDWLKKNG
jgi:hypothetical protein